MPTRRKWGHVLTIEWGQLWSRRTAMAYLGGCLLFYTAVTLLMEHVIVGAQKGWVADVQRNLWLRNWMFLPLGYIWLSIQSFVSDREQGFIRESIVSGTSRVQLLVGKVIALLGISILSLLLSLWPSLFYDSYDNSSDTLVGLLLTILSDVVLIGWVALFGLSRRSNNQTLLRMVLIIGVDFIGRVLLWGLPNLFNSPVLQWLGENLPLFLPSTAFTSWMYWEEAWHISTLGISVGYAIVLWGLVWYQWKRLVL